MKNIFLAISFTLLAGLCNAQTGTVTGKVVDKSSKPLEAATVSLHKLPDSSLVTGNRTTIDGAYQFKNLNTGKFYLEARMIGYPRVKSKVFSISAPSTDLIMPNLILTEQATALKGVSVTAQRPFIERQADKLVVNVENSIVSTGSTALEVLQRTPGITVDKDDHIQLKGKAGVTVMLDGKLTYLSGDQIANLLKNMASENIAKIEVITNPSAKYDAAGNTGIVNIITKKGRKTGLNGNVNARVSKGIYYSYNTGVSLNYKTSKFNFFGDFNHSTRKNLFKRYNKSTFRTDTLVANELKGNDINSGMHNQFKAGVDYTISKNNTVSFTLNGYDGLFKKNGSGSTNRINKLIGHQDTLLKTTTDIYSPYNNITYAVNYKGTLDSLGREISFDADYAQFKDLPTIKQFNNPFTGNPPVQSGDNVLLLTHQPSTIIIKTAKADYTHPLDSTIKLEGGVKASWVKTKNDFTYDSLANGIRQYPTRENNFIYTERILAAYLSSTFKWKKFTLQGGLRLENTQSVGDLVNAASVTSRNYTDLFPNISLNEKFSDTHQLGFSLTRRINRPDYDNINPFLYYLDQKSSFKGNPNLKPQYTLQYELSYTLKQKYIATFSYSNTHNYINEFATFDSKNQITHYTSINFDKQDSYNATLSAPGDFTPWWSSTNSLSINYDKYSNQFILSGAKQGTASYNLNIVETFKIPGDWKAELNGFYNSAGFDGTYHYQSQHAIGAGLQKTLLKKRADLKFSATDIFNTQHFYGNALYNNVNLAIRNKWESRRFTLAFTYRFGGPGTTESQKKSSGQDESSRVGGKG